MADFDKLASAKIEDKLKSAQDSECLTEPWIKL